MTFAEYDRMWRMPTLEGGTPEEVATACILRIRVLNCLQATYAHYKFLDNQYCDLLYKFEHCIRTSRVKATVAWWLARKHYEEKDFIHEWLNHRAEFDSRRARKAALKAAKENQCQQQSLNLKQSA